MNTSGLRISGPVDEFTVPVTAHMPDTLTGQFDTILLCVKSQHTISAMQQLAHHLTPDGYVVSVQNGLNELDISKIVGAERTIGAFVNFGADYVEAGHIHRGNRATVVIGELNGIQSTRIETLHRILQDFDDNAQITENIFGFLWGKVAYGAQLFATALTNDSIADALANPKFSAVYIGLAREALTVARTQQIVALGFDGFDPSGFAPDADPAASKKSLAEMVTFNRASAKTHSGVWRDLAVRKRRTEVDFFQPVLDVARENGVAVLLITRLVQLIHDIENGDREQSDANLEVLLGVMAE
ncbi:MAG: 2-dehydropantoate 2-reductase N-terminal domain-containing protein [Aggregatilineales bacterium]